MKTSSFAVVLSGLRLSNRAMHPSKSPCTLMTEARIIRAAGIQGN